MEKLEENHEGVIPNAKNRISISLWEWPRVKWCWAAEQFGHRRLLIGFDEKKRVPFPREESEEFWGLTTSWLKIEYKVEEREQE